MSVHFSLDRNFGPYLNPPTLRRVVQSGHVQLKELMPHLAPEDTAMREGLSAGVAAMKAAVATIGIINLGGGDEKGKVGREVSTRASGR